MTDRKKTKKKKRKRVPTHEWAFVPGPLEIIEMRMVNEAMELEKKRSRRGVSYRA